MADSTQSEHAREVRGKLWGGIGTVIVIAVGFFVLKQGTAYNEERDRRQAARGDTMHSVVEVILPGSDGKPATKKLSDPAVSTLRDALILPPSAGSLRDSHGYEFVYRNEGGRIVPVSSRQSSSSYMFDAFGWAAGAMAGTTVLLVVLGMWLSRQKATQSAVGD